MANHLEGSISKGVFIFKGKKKQAVAEDYCKKDVDSSGRAYELCDELWQTIDDRVQMLQSDLNTKIFDDLLQFVKSSHKLSESGRQKFLKEIPTAALITGVNSPDHALMFNNLMTLLHERVTPYVCQLRAKDCPNIRSIISKTVSLLMEAPTTEEEGEETEEEPNMKRINPTLSVLAKWYHDKLQSKSPKKAHRRQSSPRKRKAGGESASPTKASTQSPTKAAAQNTSHSDETESSGSARPPVVIVIQDLESFPAHVLQDFVTICSNHVDKLPLVLVFGIATSVTAVHRLLPNAASSLLSMEKFQAPPSSEYLTRVINQILMTVDVPFKLGHRVFSFLLDMFLFHDFSVLNFTRGLQFALLDHFSSHPWSLYCQDITSATEDLNASTTQQLTCLTSLPSFNKHIERSKEKTSPSKKDNANLKKSLAVLLKNLGDYHSCYFPVLLCLHVFAGKLPTYPIGKQIREMYAMNLEACICDLPSYEEALLLMKALSRDELLINLRACHNNLRCDELPEEFVTAQARITEFIDKLDNIDELQRKADQDQKEAAEEEANIPKKTDIYTLRKKLQEMEKKKKKYSVYEELRVQIIDFMDSLFRQYLIPPNDLPLHEVFYYDDVSVMRRTINGSPRATIQCALSDPFHYLQNEGLEAPSDGSISPELPDICIVFKLHLECGRLINLYDWLQAFMMIVSAGTEAPVKKSKSKKSASETDHTRVLQARFIRAVSELQFLGFVKPTKRKTDHVARLTWGGC